MKIELKTLNLENFKGRDLSGRKFGSLIVIEYAGKDKNHNSYWICICKCGNKIRTKGASLKNGSSKSCGCLRKEKALEAITTHGLSGGRNNTTRLYGIWRNMKSRCHNPKTPKYKNYGGRGITVCKEWNDYKVFHDWAMANGYKDNLTIERKNNYGNYEPDNCKWATYKEQSLNSRQNHIINYNGETKTLKEWTIILGIKYSTLQARLNQYGWDIISAFEKPVKIWRSHANQIT